MTTGVSSVTGISPFTFLNTTRPWFFRVVGRYAPVISAMGVWKIYLGSGCTEWVGCLRLCYLSLPAA